jgi:hypothetical protein
MDGWMDQPFATEKQNRLPFSNWEVNDLIVVVFGIAIELH